MECVRNFRKSTNFDRHISRKIRRLTKQKKKTFVLSIRFLSYGDGAKAKFEYKKKSCPEKRRMS